MQEKIRNSLDELNTLFQLDIHQESQQKSLENFSNTLNTFIDLDSNNIFPIIDLLVLSQSPVIQNLLKETIKQKFDIVSEQETLEEMIIAILQKDHRGNLPLHFAAAEGYKNIAQFFIDKGHNVNYRTHLSSFAPLHVAAQNGQSEVASILLQNNASIEIQDAGGSTPLHLAVLKGNLEMVKLLLQNGASSNALDKSGRSPIDYALGLITNEMRTLLDNRSISNPLASNLFRPDHSPSNQGMKGITR